MITKVARNVSSASPKATPMTMPATVPFESRLLGEAVALDFVVGVRDDETEL